VTFDSSYLPHPLQVALSSDPARPRLTFYDDSSGERVELSAQSLAGWVIKTTNLLIQDLGVDEESQVSLHLPLHCLTAVWVLAAEASGASVTSAAGPRGCVEVATAAGVERYAVSLRPMALPLGPDCPDGFSDFCADVRAMPDQLVQPPDSPAPGANWGDSAASALGLHPGERVASHSHADVTRVTAVVDGLLAPLAVDGSAVWTRNPDPARCVPRWLTEHVTALLGPPPEGLSGQVPAQIRHLGSSTP